MFDLGCSFIATVERNPRALAVVDGDQRVSYAEWYAEICRVIDGLAAQGLRKGDHLAVVLQNRLAIASVHWTCQLAGIIVTPPQLAAKDRRARLLSDGRRSLRLVNGKLGLV